MASPLTFYTEICFRCPVIRAEWIPPTRPELHDLYSKPEPGRCARCESETVRLVMILPADQSNPRTGKPADIPERRD